MTNLYMVIKYLLVPGFVIHLLLTISPFHAIVLGGLYGALYLIQFFLIKEMAEKVLKQESKNENS